MPAEIPIGPAIVAIENIGDEIHEIVILRKLDGSLSVEELLDLPEDEFATKAAFVGVTRAFPGGIGQTVIYLTPGDYVALCYLPEGATPEVMAQLGGPEDTVPAGIEIGPPHYELGMIHEFHV